MLKLENLESSSFWQNKKGKIEAPNSVQDKENTSIGAFPLVRDHVFYFVSILFWMSFKFYFQTGMNHSAGYLNTAIALELAFTYGNPYLQPLGQLDKNWFKLIINILDSEKLCIDAYTMFVSLITAKFNILKLVAFETKITTLNLFNVKNCLIIMF